MVTCAQAMAYGRMDRANNELNERVGRLLKERLKKQKRSTVYPLWGRIRRPHRASKREAGVGGREIVSGRLPTLRDTPSIHYSEYPSTATTSSDDYHAWSRSTDVLESSWERFMQDGGCDLRRMSLPRNRVNKDWHESRGARGMPRSSVFARGAC